MEVRKTDIKKFITSSDIVFVIPVYQRNYDWNKDNCQQLFTDVMGLVGKNDSHFMGTVCYKMEGRYKCVIIDGQQRITSIMLFLKAIYDMTTNLNLKDKVKNQFLINPYTNNDLKLKLKPIKKDEAIYKKLLNLDFFSDDYFSKDEKNSNIYRNYAFFKDWIVAEGNNGIFESDIEDAIERLEIAEIELTNENPQVIFESLNSTGMSLTNTDLLRNYLLMSMDYSDQEELYQKYWLQIENILDAENMELFLVHYLIMVRKSNAIMEKGKKAIISAKNVYYAFKLTYPNIAKGNAKEEITRVFKELFKYANFYKHFLFNQDTNLLTLSKIDKKLYDLFYRLDVKHVAVLLLYLYDKYDQQFISEDIFIETIDICISFAMRSKVCNYNSFSTQFCGLAVGKLALQPIDANFINRFWGAMVSGRGRYAFPRDDEFKDALMNQGIYESLKSSGTKYLLYTLEQNLDHAKELPPYDSGTIEHIMPQTLSKKWADYLSEKGELTLHLKYLHTLGNLALTNYNGTLSNSSFDEKSKEYSKSNYAYTKELAGLSKWSSSEIVLRASRMAEAALQIWKMDPKYNLDEQIETGVTYDLQADFPSFTGTKPAIVHVMDKESTISTWVDFVMLAAKEFYDLNSEIFREMIATSNSFLRRKHLFTETEKGLRRPRKIADDVYIELNLNTEDLLKVIKVMADYYDQQMKTNYGDEIWFTVRKK